MSEFLTKNKYILILFFILAIAAFFRLWQLDSIPPDLYPDVAINGNNALESLATGDFKVFYPDNNGREGFFMWLIALSFVSFGVSVWSIKIVAAIIGILTVLGIYLLTLELFRNTKYKIQNTRYIALLSSFFLAVSFWHVNFSRLGFRAIMVPLILTFSFWLFFRGCRTRKVLDFILGGIIFGLGFYTYISYRMAPLIVVFLIFLFWILYRKTNLKESLKFHLHIVWFILAAAIVALPIGIYFLQNPIDFAGRAAPVSVFAAENPIKEFGKSLVAHLAMFNVYGDPNWRHNTAGSPMLFWPVGILFLIGFIGGVKKIFSKSEYLSENRPLIFSFYFLFFLFFAMQLPGVLTFEGIPHALRVVGVIPAVYVFVGLGGWKTYQFLAQNTTRKRLLWLAAFLFLFATALSEFNNYFNRWAKNPNLDWAFTKTYASIGYFLNSLPERSQKYVIVNELGSPLYGISIPGQSLMFIESSKFGRPRASYIKAEEIDKIEIADTDAVIIPLYEKGVLELLSERFPQGEIKQNNDFSYFQINQTK